MQYAIHIWFSYALFSERFHHASLEHYLQRIDIIFMFTLELYGNARVHCACVERLMSVKKKD